MTSDDIPARSSYSPARSNLVEFADRLTDLQRAALRATAADLKVQTAEELNAACGLTTTELGRAMRGLAERGLVAAVDRGAWQVNADGLKVVEILPTLEALGRRADPDRTADCAVKE